MVREQDKKPKRQICAVKVREESENVGGGAMEESSDERRCNWAGNGLVEVSFLSIWTSKRGRGDGPQRGGPKSQSRYPLAPLCIRWTDPFCPPVRTSVHIYYCIMRILLYCARTFTLFLILIYTQPPYLYLYTCPLTYPPNSYLFPNTLPMLCSSISGFSFLEIYS